MAKRYIVTGTKAQFGHRPGAEFEADLAPDLEQRAIARGGIALAEDGDGLEAMKREELDALASTAGVSAPDKLANKDEVIAAIRDATNTPDSPGSNEKEE